jgi:hypothetical protein
MSNINYLDLDSVASSVDFTIKLGGVEHKVEESSVDDFIANAKAVEALALTASPVDELNLILGILGRALPTCNEAQLRKLKLNQLHKIREFVMTANGEKGEEAAAGEATASEDASGNEHTAS